MQDLASEFSKIFRRWYPELQSGRGQPSPAPNTQSALWLGAGRKRKPWSPATFQPWLRPSFPRVFIAIIGFTNSGGKTEGWSVPIQLVALDEFRLI